MADALYVKQGENLIKLDLGGGSSPGGMVSVSRQTTVLESTLPAGQPLAVPAHEKGSGKLMVFVFGILLGGDAYEDASETTITFKTDVPAGSEISALAFVSTETGADLAALSAAVNGKLDASVYEAEKKEAMR